MKKSKFSDSQILSILRQHEASVPVAQLAREHGSQHGAYLSVAIQIWRHGCLTDERDEGATCRECLTEKNVC